MVVKSILITSYNIIGNTVIKYKLIVIDKGYSFVSLGTIEGQLGSTQSRKA